MDEITLDNSWLMAGDPPNKGDEALHVRFYLKPKLNRLKTFGGPVFDFQGKQTGKVEAAGRPIYDNIEYCSIGSPGDKFNQIDRPAYDYDKRRFRRQYQAFKQSASDTGSGTPLTKWPLIDAAQVEEMKYWNVHTVEQLSLLPDGNIPNVGNISHLKKLAVDFLELAKGNAPIVALRGELEKRDEMLAAMQRQIDALISKPDAAEPKKRKAKIGDEQTT